MPLRVFGIFSRSSRECGSPLYFQSARARRPRRRQGLPACAQASISTTLDAPRSRARKRPQLRAEHLHDLALVSLDREVDRFMAARASADDRGSTSQRRAEVRPQTAAHERSSASASSLARSRVSAKMASRPMGDQYVTGSYAPSPGTSRKTQTWKRSSRRHLISALYFRSSVNKTSTIEP